MFAWCIHITKVTTDPEIDWYSPTIRAFICNITPVSTIIFRQNSNLLDIFFLYRSDTSDVFRKHQHKNAFLQI